MRAKAFLAQQFHGFNRHHALWAAAVRDDLAILRQLGQTLSQLTDRDRARPGNMAGAILLGRTHIEDRDFAIPNTLHELLAGDAFQGTAFLEVRVSDLADLRKALPRARMA
jgi:hypothetical protein